MATEIQNVTTYDQALQAMDGKAYTLDGIHGHIKIETFKNSTTITHEPSPKGKRTEAYQQTRKQLGDDWSSDLTWSERFGEIAHNLGIRFADGK